MVLLSRCSYDVDDASQMSKKECLHKKHLPVNHRRCIAGTFRLYGNILTTIWKPAIRLAQITENNDKIKKSRRGILPKKEVIA